MRKLKIVSGDKMFSKAMKRADFRRAYEDLEPEFQIARQVIKARIEKGYTQKNLAEKIGTKQPSIARLEGMGSIPTISQIKKIAEVLNKRLVIRFA